MSRLPFLALLFAVPLAAPALAQDVSPTVEAPTAEAPAGAITVRNVARVELEPGLAIVDPTGREIGTVDHLDGADVVLTAPDGAAIAVPVVQLYAARRDGVDTFASRVGRADLLAQGRVEEGEPQNGG